MLTPFSWSFTKKMAPKRKKIWEWWCEQNNRWTWTARTYEVEEESNLLHGLPTVRLVVDEQSSKVVSSKRNRDVDQVELWARVVSFGQPFRSRTRALTSHVTKSDAPGLMMLMKTDAKILFP